MRVIVTATSNDYETYNDTHIPIIIFKKSTSFDCNMARALSSCPKLPLRCWYPPPQCAICGFKSIPTCREKAQSDLVCSSTLPSEQFSHDQRVQNLRRAQKKHGSIHSLLKIRNLLSCYRNRRGAIGEVGSRLSSQRNLICECGELVRTSGSEAANHRP